MTVLGMGALALGAPALIAMDGDDEGTPPSSRAPLTPEMYGAGDHYDATVDDRPAIQRAIDAAVELGRPLRFLRSRYALFRPARTSPYDRQFATDGHYLIVRGDLDLLGAPGGTTLVFLGERGAPGETFRLIAGTDATPARDRVWRGHGLYFLRPGGWQPSPLLWRFSMRDVLLDGDCRYTGNFAGPPHPVTGDGWDFSHKPWNGGDQNLYFDMTLIGGGAVRWRGEMLYGMGGPGTKATLAQLPRIPRMVITDATFSDCNATLNNTGGHVRAHFMRTTFARGGLAEVLAPQGHRYTGCRARDCNGGGYCGGPDPDYVGPQIFLAQHDRATPIPWIEFEDCQFDNCGSVRFGSFVRGAVRGTDTEFGLFPVGRNSDVQLKVESRLDRRDRLIGFRMDVAANDLTTPADGMPPGSAAVASIAGKVMTVQTMAARPLLPGMTVVGRGIAIGTRITATLGAATHAVDPAQSVAPGPVDVGFYNEPMANIAIDLTLSRSTAARSAGRRWTSPFNGAGLVRADSVRLTARGELAFLHTTWGFSLDPAQVRAMPLIDERAVAFDQSYGDGLNGQDIRLDSGETRIQPTRTLVTLRAAHAGPHRCEVATDWPAIGAFRPTYSNGQEIVLVHGGGTAAFTFATTGAGLRLAAPRALARGGASLRLRYDATIRLWVEVAWRPAPSPGA